MTDGRPVVAHLKTPYGGLTETFIHRTVTGLRRYRSVVVTCQTDCPDAHSDVATEIVERPARRGDALALRISVPVLARQLPYERFWRRALREVRPAVIHAHFGASALYLLPLRRSLHAPIVTSFYGYDLSELPRIPRYRGFFSERRLFGAIERCLVEGGAARQALIDLGCPSDKVEVVRIGVDLSRLEFRERVPRAGAPARVFFCGRFIPKKGLPDAIRAVASVRDRGCPVELRIAGYGPQEAEARALASRLGLNGLATWLGALPYERFAQEMLACDIMLAPSATDPLTGDTEGGAPTVLLEAQATGMPVVSTTHADIPEVVRDGRSALLAPERDVAGIADRLAWLIGHPERWGAFGREGRAHVEREHDAAEIARRHEDVYDRVVAGWKGSSW